MWATFGSRYYHFKNQLQLKQFFDFNMCAQIFSILGSEITSLMQKRVIYEVSNKICPDCDPEEFVPGCKEFLADGIKDCMPDVLDDLVYNVKDAAKRLVNKIKPASTRRCLEFGDKVDFSWNGYVFSEMSLDGLYRSVSERVTWKFRHNFYLTLNGKLLNREKCLQDYDLDEYKVYAVEVHFTPLLGGSDTKTLSFISSNFATKIESLIISNRKLSIEDCMCVGTSVPSVQYVAPVKEICVPRNPLLHFDPLGGIKCSYCRMRYSQDTTYFSDCMMCAVEEKVSQPVAQAFGFDWSVLLNPIRDQISAFKLRQMGEVESIVDAVLNQLEALPLIMNDFHTAKTNLDVVCAVIRMIKLTSRFSITKTVMDMGDTVMAILNELSKEMFDEQGFEEEPAGPVAQVGEFAFASGMYQAEQGMLYSFEWVIKGCRKLITNMHQVVEGAAYQKLATLFKYFLSFGIFQTLGLDFKKLGLKDWELKSMMRGHNSRFHFIVDVFDTIVWFCERAMQCTKGELKWSSFFHSGETYGKWVEDFHWLKTNEHRVLDPDAFASEGFDYHKYIQKLEETLETGKALSHFLSGEFEKKTVSASLRELTYMKDTIISRKNCQRSRDAPFSLLLVGPTSVAKTSLTEILFQCYAKWFNKSTDEECMYIRTPSDKFWSGFSPRAWCIVIDDMAAMNPNLGQVDETVTDGIRINNNCRLTATSATVEEKGKLAVRPDLFIANTNVEDLNAKYYYSCPAALLRRFPYVIRVHVKPEYRVDASNVDSMIDPNKIDVKEKNLMDVWDFEVAYVRNDELNTKAVKTSVVHQFSGDGAIYQLLKWFKVSATSHRMNQAGARKARTQAKVLQLCPDCCYPLGDERCTCAQAQAGHATLADIENSFTLRSEVKYEISVLDGARRDLAAFQERLGVSNAAYSMTFDDEGNIVFELNEDETLSEEALEDNRSVFTRALDYASDMWEMAYTEALYIASIAKEFISSPADILRYLGERAKYYTSQVLDGMVDLITCRQIIMAKDAFVSFGKSVYDKLSDWRVIGFCALLTAGIAAAEGVSFLYRELSGECNGCVQLDKDCMMLYNQGLFNECQSCQNRRLGLVPCDEETAKAVKEPIKAQGVVESTWKKDNVWIKDQIEMSDFHISAKSVGWKNKSFDEVLAVLQRNVVHIMHSEDNFDKWHAGKMLHTATAIGLCGHLYVSTAHCFTFVKEAYARVTRHPIVQHASANIRVILEREFMVETEDDLVFFELTGLPPVADITDLFFKNRCETLVCKGAYIHCRFNQYPEVNKVNKIWQNTECGVITNIQREVGKNLWRNCPTGSTRNGDCGSMLVGDTPMGPVILGVHQLRFTNGDSASISLTQETIREIQKKFAPQVEAGAPNLFGKKLLKLDRKSTAWQTRADGKGEFHGTLEGSAYRNSGDSKVSKTIICEAAVAEGFKDDYLPPVMVGPYAMGRNVTTNTQHPSEMRMSIVKKACDSYVKKIIAGLTVSDMKTIATPLTVMEAVNGIPGVKFIDKMNRNTSMGFPFFKSKRNFLVPVEADGWSDAMEFNAEVMEEVNQIHTCYREGRRYSPVFKMSLKDEAVPLKKVIAQKTRGFKGGPAAWQIVVRQVMLPFVKVFQENPFLFEGAPGMNCNSCSWKRLYKFVTEHGVDRCIAGDFAAFDTTMLADMILEIFRRVYVKIFEYCQAPQWMINFLYCIAEDVAFHVCSVQGDIMTFYGGNPSGWALTVILNCTANSIYMRIVFYHVTPEGITVDEFHIYINLMTYGDDNVMNAKVDWFNHTEIQNVLAEYGITYTMADKETASVPFINIRDVTFLKRSFVPCDGGARVACPLAWESIDKMLTSCIPSKTICQEEQAVQTIRSAVGEFFQYGPKMYKENCDKMKRIVERCNLQPWVTPSTFPTYEDLLCRHYAGCIYDDSTCRMFAGEDSEE